MLKKYQTNEKKCPQSKKIFEMGIKGGKFTSIKHLLCVRLFTCIVSVVCTIQPHFTRESEAPRGHVAHQGHTAPFRQSCMMQLNCDFGLLHANPSLVLTSSVTSALYPDLSGHTEAALKIFLPSPGFISWLNDCSSNVLPRFELCW